MKTFLNKVTGIPNDDGSKMMFSELIIACLNYKGDNRGFTPEEILARLPLVKKMKEAKPEEVVELENAEAQKVLNCVNEMLWAILHEDIGAFTEAIREELK